MSTSRDLEPARGCPVEPAQTSSPDSTVYAWDQEAIRPQVHVAEDGVEIPIERVWVDSQKPDAFDGFPMTERPFRVVDRYRPHTVRPERVFPRHKILVNLSFGDPVHVFDSGFMA